MNVDIIERLNQERAELKFRLDKLILFLDDQKKEQTVSDLQLNLLNRQRLFMQGYKNVLDMRIRNLEMRKDFGETL
nr:hypothetical protein [Limosilactobacillus mucosae]